MPYGNISLIYADVPTHLQKAQLITIGKRFTLYCDELNMVSQVIEAAKGRLSRGGKSKTSYSAA